MLMLIQEQTHMPGPVTSESCYSTGTYFASLLRPQILPVEPALLDM